MLCRLIFLTVAVGGTMEHGLVTIFGGVVHVGSGVLGRREALSGLPTVLVSPATSLVSPALTDQLRGPPRVRSGVR